MGTEALGDRMKDYYEDITRYYLPRKTYVLLRIDGKAFHTYTRGMIRPFDDGLIDDMDATAKFLCEKIQGARFAYTQSDEISILLTDFNEENPTKNTEAWFDNNLQKMGSISASLATSEFNKLRVKRIMNENGKIAKVWNDSTQTFEFNTASLVNVIDYVEKIKSALDKTANFDSRLWTVPQRSEVINYFIFRQQDATRNSISSVAQSKFSHKQLEGKSSDEKQEMIFQKDGTNWNNLAPRYKRGRGVMRVEKEVELDASVIKKANAKAKSEWIERDGKYYVLRNTWEIVDVPIFSQKKSFFDNIIPKSE